MPEPPPVFSPGSATKQGRRVSIRVRKEVAPLQEEKLLERLRRGERAALEQAVERFTPYVSAVAARAAVGIGREDLEEVTADVFLALWKHAGEIQRGSLRPWLAAVARNRARNKLRTPPASLPLEEGAPDQRPGPEEESQRREDARRLWQAVERLEQPDREVVLRYYFYEEKTREIAGALGLNHTTVRSKLSRSRKKLRQWLTEEGLV